MSKRRENGQDFGGYGKLGDELLWLGAHADVLAGEVWVTEIRLKVSVSDGVEHMAVIKATQDGKAVVGFVTAPELDVLVHLVAAKLANGSIGWREDKPYEPRQ